MMVKNIIPKEICIFFANLLLLAVCVIPVQADGLEEIPFSGSGTLKDPYLITSREDISSFRDFVNDGTDFQDQYFYQTSDVDLLDIPWTPIGIYDRGNYFLGTYNGGGHVIRNLRIDEVEDPEGAGINNQGLFGQLGGVVLNLGIESGSITGSCVGSIASHSAPDTQPYIINCYSRAQLSGYRAGGIVDNFGGGTVINCWYDASKGGLHGVETGTIASCAGRLIDCFGQDNQNPMVEQLEPRSIASLPKVTRESERGRTGVLYACARIDADMLIPWECEGVSLRFSDQPFDKPSVIPFQGKGTRSAPYLIQSYEDLCVFRNLVYLGNEFENIYFCQTENVTMETDDWIPIGVFGTGHYFKGIYDGTGHTISNLNNKAHADWGDANNGLFGQLGGIVLNLGIESGNISGSCVGSIASHSAPGTQPYIINCYSRAALSGFRAGGIADNFGGGTIINCWYKPPEGGLNGPYTGTIASYSGTLIDCFGQDGKDFIGEQINPRSMNDVSQITRQTENMRTGVLYACARINREMLIPWEYDGTFLRFSDQPLEPHTLTLQGSGTRSDPYLISSYEDLCEFRDLVYIGNEFQNTCFRQTVDIEMKTDDWIPIGVCDTGHYFWGVYDGAGHIISNLNIKKDSRHSDNGLFGQLGGVVANLGIESGRIEGNCAGSIACRFANTGAALGSSAAILNCYSRASLCGTNVGGIAYSFNYGVIANCWSDPNISLYEGKDSSETKTSDRANGIVCSAYMAKVYSCYTTEHQVMPPVKGSKSSQALSEEKLYSQSFVNKLNFTAALTQTLFGNHYGVDLLEWRLDESGMLRYDTGEFLINLFQILNEFLPVFILGVVLFAVWFRTRQVGVQNLWKRFPQQIIAGAVIFGVISAFVDCAAIGGVTSVLVDYTAIGAARDPLNLGNILLLVLCNYAFLFFGRLIYQNVSIPRDLNSVKRILPLLVVMGAALILEAAQFNNVPRYDASLYYGSLVEGISVFRLDFFTYWGAFLCMQPVHGTVLLTPLELIYPGRMIGFYLSNVVVTEVTLVIMYCLLRECYENISPLFASLGSAALLLCPYQLGMFTHYCSDSLLVYFAVWLIYAYKRKNNLLIAFCGFLMSFTKITGAGFYVVFLVAVALYEVISQYRGNIVKRVQDWWRWGKCLLWMTPSALYALYHLNRKWLAILNYEAFGGGYDIQLGGNDPAQQIVTLRQSLVYGFRWLFILLILIGIALVMTRRKQVWQYVNNAGLQLIFAAGAAGFAVMGALLVLYFPSHIGRNTALLSVWYVLCLPLAIQLINAKRNTQLFGMGALIALLFIQTYWTIDPSIFKYCKGVNTGQTKVYDLVGGNRFFGDAYAYNMEHNFYNSLIEKTLREIDPTRDDPCYVLDVGTYELHLNGMQYPIYWNVRTGRPTYDVKDPDSILLPVYTISTKSLVAKEGPLSLKDHMYLFVPARIDETKALQRLQADGYRVVKSYPAENLYGAMNTYELQK